MNPRLKAPPGNWSQRPLSMAERNLVLMRVADESSSRETPRISRSRLRCSPNGEVEAIRQKNIGVGQNSVNPTGALYPFAGDQREGESGTLEKYPQKARAWF
jgi:hypothetical protein